MEKTEKSVTVSIKIAVPVVTAIDESVHESPIEFRSRADFIKRAVEAELRKRGKIKKFKE